jgi:3',5'-cyclic AMP phosphodiesterase CpdA
MSEAPRDALIHIGDLHFWRVVLNPLRLLNKRALGNLNVMLRRRQEFDMDRAEPCADAVAATGIKHALLTGDFTSTSIDEEFEMARTFVDGLAQRGLGISLMPGNHDVYTFEAQRARRFERHFEPYLPPEGYPARVMLPGGTHLILVPGAQPNLLTAKGYVGDDVIAQVAALLADAPEPVLVAAHYPVLSHTYGYTLTPERQMGNAQALRSALGASGKRILYLCGHVHRFSYVTDPEYPNLAHVSTAAFFRHHKSRGIQGDFTEVHVLADGFHVRRHVHRQAWEVEDVTPQ